ncbi:MAG: FIST N-terminal domain-containing protein [Nanoarchaeota archaeon]
MKKVVKSFSKVLKKGNSKHISVGVGASKNKDSYLAAVDAAKQALAECKTNQPTFSFVFVDSRYEPIKVLKGINKILGTKNWVGCSTDRQLNNKIIYTDDPVITVISIKTEYMHFGVGAVENYRKDSFNKGVKAIKEAISKVKVDQYIAPYIQFRRAQIKDYTDIVKTPPYFILSFMSGTYYINKNVVMGKETEFIEGFLSVTGANIPVFGSVSNSDFGEFMKGKGKNFQYANGKLLKDGGIAVFVVSSLYFSHALEHGYKETDIVAMITKVDKSGHIVEQINGKPSVDEYCRLVKIKKEDFLKNPYKYTLTKSLAVIDSGGQNYIKAMGTTPDGKYLFSQAKLPPKVAVTLVNFDKKKVIEAATSAVSNANRAVSNQNIAFVWISSCSARRAVLGIETKKEALGIMNAFKNVPFFGFYTFGEIGSNKARTCQLNEQTITLLTVYDRLLTQ